jgi:chaperonin cofactor prefoldin
LLGGGWRARTPTVNIQALVGAVQRLNQKLEEIGVQFQALKRQNASLEKRLNALELLIPSAIE